jgi:hypothetical protein
MRSEWNKSHKTSDDLQNKRQGRNDKKREGAKVTVYMSNMYPFGPRRDKNPLPETRTRPPQLQGHTRECNSQVCFPNLAAKVGPLEPVARRVLASLFEQ